MFLVGQGVLGRVTFTDGVEPAYDRTYLVVYVKTQEIGLLNVSSIAGKEHKLALPTNKQIKKYKPPFKKPSFVKLDSLVYVPKNTTLSILHNGDCLDTQELNDIISQICL